MKRLLEWLSSLFTWPDIETEKQEPKRTLAWGKKMTAECREKVFAIARELGVDPNYLMAVMAFESGGTFRPDIKNFAGSGATGLIQFMPATARGLGTSVEALAKMTVLEQLDWVYAYFRPYRSKLETLSDVYMAVLYPKALGKPEDYVLWDKATKPTTYRQNAGLDANKDGSITKREAAQKVSAMLKKGLEPANYWVEP